MADEKTELKQESGPKRKITQITTATTNSPMIALSFSIAVNVAFASFL